MVSAASMRKKRAKNVQRDIKMREEREIVRRMCAKRENVTGTTKFVQMDVTDVTNFVKIDVTECSTLRDECEICESRGGEFDGGSRRRTHKHQSINCHVLGPVDSDCEGEEVNAVDAVPSQQK